MPPIRARAVQKTAQGTPEDEHMSIFGKLVSAIFGSSATAPAPTSWGPSAKPASPGAPATPTSSPAPSGTPVATGKPMSRAELEDLARARMVVEMPLFLESIANGGREWEDAVVTAHYRLSRCKTAVDDPSDAAVDKWDESHEAFHAALLSAATSNWLLRFRSTIADQLRRHHRFLGLAPTLRAAAGLKDGYGEAMDALREAIAIEHHTEIMEAALDRDVERAKALMTAHIGYTLHVYVHSEDSGANNTYAARAGSLKAVSG